MLTQHKPQNKKHVSIKAIINRKYFHQFEFVTNLNSSGVAKGGRGRARQNTEM